MAPLPGTLTRAKPHPASSLLCPVMSPTPISPGLWCRGHGPSACLLCLCREDRVGLGLDPEGGRRTSSSASDQATHLFVPLLPELYSRDHSSSFVAFFFLRFYLNSSPLTCRGDCGSYLRVGGRIKGEARPRELFITTESCTGVLGRERNHFRLTGDTQSTETSTGSNGNAMSYWAPGMKGGCHPRFSK